MYGRANCDSGKQTIQRDHQTIRAMVVLSRYLTAIRPIRLMVNTFAVLNASFECIINMWSMSGVQQRGGISSNILPLLPLDNWVTKWDAYFVFVNKSTLSPFTACITEQSWVSVWHPCQLCVLDDFNIIVLLEGCNLCYGFTVNVIEVLPSRSVLCYKIRQLYTSYLLH